MNLKRTNINNSKRDIRFTCLNKSCLFFGRGNDFVRFRIKKRYYSAEMFPELALTRCAFFINSKISQSKATYWTLAVGIIIGAAFTTVTQSLVNDIIMPPVGKIIDNVNFSNLYIALDQKARGIPSVEDARKAGAVIAYGNFIQNIINFLIISLAVFLLVNFVHALRRAEEKKPVAAPPAPSTEEKLLMEILDAIKNLETKIG